MLNLWQKNGVFKIEIIQPLLDMAAGTSNAVPVAENVTNNEGTVACLITRQVPESTLASLARSSVCLFVLFWLVGFCLYHVLFLFFICLFVF